MDKTKRLNFSSKNISWKKVFALLIWMYFSILMVQITLEYIPIQLDVSFLSIKQEEVTAVFGYIPMFYIHVYSSLFVLVIGMVQLFQLKPIVHRVLGYVYVFILILFAAPSGIFIGIYANGGGWAQLAFVLLGILWLFYTIRSMMRIRNQDYKGHQFDMWRSYALTLSALTLRAWKVGIVYFFQPNPLDAYIIVAWLGWVLNLIGIELYIHHKIKNYE